MKKKKKKAAGLFSKCRFEVQWWSSLNKCWHLWKLNYFACVFFIYTYFCAAVHILNSVLDLTVGYMSWCSGGVLINLRACSTFYAEPALLNTFPFIMPSSTDASFKLGAKICHWFIRLAMNISKLNISLSMDISKHSYSETFLWFCTNSSMLFIKLIRYGRLIHWPLVWWRKVYRLPKFRS